MATMTRPSMFLALAAVLLGAHVAGAACTSEKCPDEAAVERVRSLVAVACDCENVKSHGRYVKCARDVIKGAIREGTLAKSCRKTVLGCETQSTCGMRKAAVCCALTKSGRVKARVIGRSARCSGTPCSGALSTADACTAEGACAPRKRQIKSFRSVQQVFTSSCALPSCHSTFARKGDLVLESEDVSYVSLVGRDAAHPDAKAQGTKRVVPGDAASSYLVKKLRAQGPGDPMPQAGRQLSEPVIKMVEDWINRGAKTVDEECKATPGDTGEINVCDRPTQTGDYVWQPLPPLEKPAENEGIQLYMPPKPVAPGTEWETCYAVRPNWPEIARKMGQTSGLPFIRQQTYRMHEGSHHLLLYAYYGNDPDAFPDGFFPCFAANCLNRSDCPADSFNMLPIGGTQVAGTRYEVKYPQGVGIPILSERTVLIINPHFTNPFLPAQDTYGEAWLNLYFYHPGEAKAILDGIFAINAGDLFVEPFQTRTISRIWSPRSLLGRAPVDASIFQLFGHMHKRGTEFRIDYVKGGACATGGAVCGKDSDCRNGSQCVRAADAEDSTIYYTTSWDEAPIMDFSPPYLSVKQTEGLRWTCTHTNGVAGDPSRPPHTCAQDQCDGSVNDQGRVVGDDCAWDDANRKCIFSSNPVRAFAEGEPMPLTFGERADDDMCNMFGYFLHTEDLPKIGQ